MATVLVTGGSGFIGSHAIARLLADGHAVHTSVRRLDRADVVRALLRNAGVDAGDRLRFFAADLLREHRGDGHFATASGGPGSHLMGGLSTADGLAWIDAEIDEVRAGDRIRVIGLDGEFV